MLRVLVPPKPIVVPGDLQGDYDTDSAAAVIAAVTAAIDGPEGWLGRALGEQTLELSGRDFYQRDFPTDRHLSHLGLRLPCQPLIEVETVKYLDADEVEHTIDESVYRVADGCVWLRKGQSWPALGDFPDAARIRYRAGYDGNPVADGGTGDVPFGAKQAIIIATTHLTSMPATGFLALESVEGIGRTDYAVTGDAARVIDSVCNQLLQGLRVFR